MPSELMPYNFLDTVLERITVSQGKLFTKMCVVRCYILNYFPSLPLVKVRGVLNFFTNVSSTPCVIIVELGGLL